MTELGQDSLLWRWAGDNRIGFLGPTIGLLQLMHPAIGAGVLEHSDFFRDPFGRIERSLPLILGVVYDDPEADTGRTVKGFHRDIKGTDSGGRRYHALNPETFWWAHATFQFMAEQVADRFDTHRLRRAEREQLYAEGLEWYRRYGVSDRAVPADRAAFGAEWDRICGEVLEMNEAVQWVLGEIRNPSEVRLPPPLAYADPIMRLPPLRRLAFEPIRVAAIGGLPRIVRERFDIPWGIRDQAELEALQLAVAQCWRFLPPTVRWHPRAQAGWRRARRERAVAAGGVAA